jgi:hypothetical protein
LSEKRSFSTNGVGRDVPAGNQTTGERAVGNDGYTEGFRFLSKALLAFGTAKYDRLAHSFSHICDDVRQLYVQGERRVFHLDGNDLITESLDILGSFQSLNAALAEA